MEEKYMKKLIKIFGLGAAFLIISLSITPIYSSQQINEIIEKHQNLSDWYQHKIFENKKKDINEDPEQTLNNDTPGNNGYLKFQQRMGWKYDKKYHIRNMSVKFIRIGVVALITIGIPIGTILAIMKFLEISGNEETDPYDLYELAAEILALILGILLIVEGRPIAKRISEFYDSVDAFYVWLGEEHWKTDMIIYGWIMRCKPFEEIKVSCRGESKTYAATLAGRVKYEMIVPCIYYGEEPKDSHNCEIIIEGNKHERTLKTKLGDEWCYSDGMLRNWFNWIV